MPLSSGKFIILSASIHIFILFTFIFTFRNITEPFKPTIMFLGSILKEEEVVEGNEPQMSPQKLLASDTLQLLKTASNEHTFVRIELNKPLAPDPVTGETKSFIKSTFPTIQLPSGPTRSSNKGINDVPAMPYRPLQLYPDDQN